MSLYAELQSATTEAHSVLAQIQGMAQTATGNFLYQGSTFLGVFGNPVEVDTMQVGGGYKRRVNIPLVISREAMAAAPQVLTTLVRLYPRIEYRIESVEEHGPLEWRLMLLKVGAV